MSDTTKVHIFDPHGEYTEHALASQTSVVGLNERWTNLSISPLPETSNPALIDATIPFATLDEIEQALSAHPAGLSKEFAGWLVRICRASDARVVELERMLKEKECDYAGIVSEWQDLADENRRLKQQAEVDRVVCDSQEQTILDLQARVSELTKTHSEAMPL